MINFVAPRDVFNKANLTKCVGKLAQYIERGMLPGVELNIEDELFSVLIDPNTGDMVTSNVIEFDPPINSDICSAYLRRGCNSRDSWPLWLVLDDESEEVPVFTSEGGLSDDFVEFYEMHFRGDEQDRNIRNSELSDSLFALAKFEKACGKLSLDIHDYKLPERGLIINDERYGLLGLNTQKNNGSYYVDSLLALKSGEELMLCEANTGELPLMLEVDNGQLIQVFNSDGSEYTPYFNSYDFSSMQEVRDEEHENDPSYWSVGMR